MNEKEARSKCKALIQELEKLGKPQYVEDSIDCWINTRILGRNVSLHCDYAEVVHVGYLDSVLNPDGVDLRGER